MTERNPDTAGVGIECGKSTFGEGTEGSALRMRLHYFSILYKYNIDNQSYISYLDCMW